MERRRSVSPAPVGSRYTTRRAPFRMGVADLVDFLNLVLAQRRVLMIPPPLRATPIALYGPSVAALGRLVRLAELRAAACSSAVAPPSRIEGKVIDQATAPSSRFRKNFRNPAREAHQRPPASAAICIFEQVERLPLGPPISFERAPTPQTKLSPKHAVSLPPGEPRAAISSALCSLHGAVTPCEPVSAGRV